MEIPTHESVPEHSLMSLSDIDKLVKKYKIAPMYFPKILVTDPVAVWYGIRAGNVVRVKRRSETAGYAYVYRICI